MTVTLAELYVRQGLIGRAREIYRRLAEAGDETARRRLAELPSAEGAIAGLRELLKRGQDRRRGDKEEGCKEDLPQSCAEVDGSLAARAMGVDGSPGKEHGGTPP